MSSIDDIIEKDNPTTTTSPTTAEDQQKKSLFSSLGDYINRLLPAGSRRRNYGVDTLAVWSFYNPPFALMEYFWAGLSGDQVLKSRAMAMLLQATTVKTIYAPLRQKWADYWHADHSSSKMKKWIVDTTGFMMYQIPVYTATLLIAGADEEKILKALPTGITLGILSGRPFGWWVDKCRKYLDGSPPTLDTYQKE